MEERDKLKNGYCTDGGCDLASLPGSAKCGVHTYMDELRASGVDVEYIRLDKSQMHGTRYIVGE